MQRFRKLNRALLSSSTPIIHPPLVYPLRILLPLHRTCPQPSTSWEPLPSWSVSRTLINVSYRNDSPLCGLHHFWLLRCTLKCQYIYLISLQAVRLPETYQYMSHINVLWRLGLPAFLLCRSSILAFALFVPSLLCSLAFRHSNFVCTP